MPFTSCFVSSWLPNLRQSRLVGLTQYVSVLFQSQQSFANVPVTADGVETISFLEAADGLMDLFGKSSIISSQQYPASFSTDTR